ncbi:MAG TPA: hypothetical protein PLA73_08740, partial [Sedimentibacter sp.]|nr:hypothetical protein [Sedimentibacter sp.]
MLLRYRIWVALTLPIILIPFLIAGCIKVDNKTNSTDESGILGGEILIDSFKNGYHSPELFTLPNGVNEFDLLFEDGVYHLFYDDKTQVRHRSATTIDGLSSAECVYRNIRTAIPETSGHET